LGAGLLTPPVGVSFGAGLLTPPFGVSFGAGLLTPPVGVSFGAGLLTPPVGRHEVWVFPGTLCLELTLFRYNEFLLVVSRH